MPNVKHREQLPLQRIAFSVGLKQETLMESNYHSAYSMIS